jgi:Phenol hydroxylase subunit
MIGGVSARRQQETLSMVQRASPGDAPPAFDLRQRYVRLLQVRPDGFVEFEFAIGEPGLAVELILPADAYREFCRSNGVIELTPIRPTSQP